MLHISGRLGLDQPAVYEIRLLGELRDDWTEWLDDGPRVSLVGISVDEGVTTVRSTVADQSALHGLLNKVRDLSLTLLSVSCIGAMRSLA